MASKCRVISMWRWGHCFCFRHVCGERYFKYADNDHVTEIGVRRLDRARVLIPDFSPTLYMAITRYMFC